MKARASILATLIALATGSVATVTPSAQACAITPEGECLSAVVKTHPSLGFAKHQPAKALIRAKGRSHRSAVYAH